MLDVLFEAMQLRIVPWFFHVFLRFPTMIEWAYNFAKLKLSAYHAIALSQKESPLVGFLWQGGRSAKGGGRVGADGGRAQSIFLGFAAGYERLRSCSLLGLMRKIVVATLRIRVYLTLDSPLIES